MLDVTEAGQRSGRHPGTIRRWICAGKLRARRVGALAELPGSGVLTVDSRLRRGADRLGLVVLPSEL